MEVFGPFSSDRTKTGSAHGRAVTLHCKWPRLLSGTGELRIGSGPKGSNPPAVEWEVREFAERFGIDCSLEVSQEVEGEEIAGDMPDVTADSVKDRGKS